MSRVQYRRYRRKNLSEMRPYIPGEDLSGVSINEVDRAAGSPKKGDWIARNIARHSERWLVSKAFFADNFEPEPEPEL